MRTPLPLPFCIDILQWMYLGVNLSTCRTLNLRICCVVLLNPPTKVQTNIWRTWPVSESEPCPWFVLTSSVTAFYLPPTHTNHPVLTLFVLLFMGKSWYFLAVMMSCLCCDSDGCVCKDTILNFTRNSNWSEDSFDEYYSAVILKTTLLLNWSVCKTPLQASLTFFVESVLLYLSNHRQTETKYTKYSVVVRDTRQ